MLTVEVLEPWNETPYEHALARQAELAAAGQKGWLLFCCPPTITLGRRARRSDVLATEAELRRQGVRLLDVDRGGEVTYHGPGQIIGFPYGTLEDHAGDSRAVRAFVEGFKGKLARLITAHGHRLAERCDGAGLWVLDDSGSAASDDRCCPPRGGPERPSLDARGVQRKILSIGLAFGRDGIRHGFSLNVLPLADRFALINPCGARGAPRQASLSASESTRLHDVTRALIDILSAER